ncbi:MAG: response regulator [Candidatus Marinimicrobia bacterium]|nr:response regulator [Candidatus Neomarinimicrobiota bacterium]
MKNTQTILIIDDDIDLVEILRVNLEHNQFNVLDAQSGEHGIKIANELSPDLIILDVMMGNLDEGFHTAYALRQNPSTQFIPIVMLTAISQETGYSFRPEKDEAFLPVDEFLEKPVNPEKLVDIIRKYLPVSA